MTTQLALIQPPQTQETDAGEITWKLSPETVSAGLKGIVEARKALEKSKAHSTSSTDLAA